MLPNLSCLKSKCTQEIGSVCHPNPGTFQPPADWVDPLHPTPYMLLTNDPNVLEAITNHASLKHHAYQFSRLFSAIYLRDSGGGNLFTALPRLVQLQRLQALMVSMAHVEGMLIHIMGKILHSYSYFNQMFRAVRRSTSVDGRVEFDATAQRIITPNHQPDVLLRYLITIGQNLNTIIVKHWWKSYRVGLSGYMRAFTQHMVNLDEQVYKFVCIAAIIPQHGRVTNSQRQHEVVYNYVGMARSIGRLTSVKIRTPGRYSGPRDPKQIIYDLFVRMSVLPNFGDWLMYNGVSEWPRFCANGYAY